MQKKVGIIPNVEKDIDFAVTKRLVAYLTAHDCEPQIVEQVAQETGLSRYAHKEEEVYAQSDFVISLGGDGTLLGVGRKSAPYGTPILGINLGHLGFLTAEENAKAESAITKVLDGQFKMEKRMMLETSISTEKEERIEGVLALNDICINRGLLYKILEFNVFINHEYVDTFQADGVIICTPTGSTAYNLSAGGPILKSDAQIIAITPISAHTLTSRSIVVSAEDTVMVEVNPREDTAFTVSADGQEAWTLTGKQVVKIKRAKEYVSIIRTNTQSFYDVLRRKLGR